MGYPAGIEYLHGDDLTLLSVVMLNQIDDILHILQGELTVLLG